MQQNSNMNPELLFMTFFGNGLVFSNGDVCTNIIFIIIFAVGILRVISKIKTILQFYKKWRTYRKLATPAFNSALSPEIVGETVMDLYSFIQQNLNRPIDIFEVMQRTTIEVLGKLAFGYRFGVNIKIYYCFFFD